MITNGGFQTSNVANSSSLNFQLMKDNAALKCAVVGIIVFVHPLSFFFKKFKVYFYSKLTSYKHEEIFINKFFSFLVSFAAVAQTPFITIWDLSKLGRGTNNQILFNVTTAPGQAINYTWIANGGTPSSGSGIIDADATSINITGLPADQIITLSIEPQNLKAFVINNSADKLRLTDVKQWGTANWSTMENTFKDAANLNITATDVPNLSNVTNMSSMFYGCTSLTGPSNIDAWNAAAVTNMGSMFCGATKFNQNIGTWNTAAVTNMSFMFYGARAFNQNISAWNTAAVTNMVSMFFGASAFNQNISAWNTAEVTNLSGMFYEATAFNQNIGAWNTAKVTKLSGMFNGATAFNQNIGAWNTSKVTDMGNMFTGARSFNQNIGAWNTAAVTSMYAMFNGANAFNQNVGTWLLNADVDLGNIFNGSGLNCANYSSTLIAWANNSNTPNGKNLGTNTLTYVTDAVAARTTLTNKGWTMGSDVAGTSACLSPLPVGFGEFNATKQANDVKLTWYTLSES